MDLRVKEVICNLKNYNFDVNGTYRMDEMEAKKLLDGLEASNFSENNIFQELEDEKKRLLYIARNYESVGNWLMAEKYSQKAIDYANAIKILRGC